MPMAGESWKSHKNSAVERDMDADHQAQLSEWAPPRITTTQKIVQEIRDGYARDVDPAGRAAHAQAADDPGVDPYWHRSPEYGREWDALRPRHDAENTHEQAETADQITADWAWNTGHSIDPNGSAQVYVPPPPDPQYRVDADYPSVVAANARVVPAGAPQPDADTARFQTQLAIAQKVAAQQVRAQRQADTEAAERLASAALGQYIPPPRNVPARTPHR
jgi:hypothetical protein